VVHSDLVIYTNGSHVAKSLCTALKMHLYDLACLISSKAVSAPIQLFPIPCRRLKNYSKLQWDSCSATKLHQPMH